MKRVGKITQEAFDYAKMLQRSGASTEEIARFTGLGISTVFRIKGAETLEEYKQIAFEAYARSKKAQEERHKAKEPVKAQEEEPKKEEPKPVKDIASMYYQQNRLLEEMKQINENLRLISNKLAFIVEQLA